MEKYLRLENIYDLLELLKDVKGEKVDRYIKDLNIIKEDFEIQINMQKVEIEYLNLIDYIGDIMDFSDDMYDKYYDYYDENIRDLESKLDCNKYTKKMVKNYEKVNKLLLEMFDNIAYDFMENDLIDFNLL